MRYQFNILLAAGTILCPFSAHAADRDDVPGLAGVPAPAVQSTLPAGDDDADDEIVVSAARTRLPANALPLTVDVIDREQLRQQVAIAGSTVDAVANLSPSFSPTRQKLSGAGESLRGRAPLFAINGIPQTTPIRDGSRDGYTIDPFFLDRVELIYGANALQGIGATGGVINQVVVEAPKSDGIAGRLLLQGNASDGFEDAGFGGKAAGLVAWRGGAFDATVGAAFERRGVFLDGNGDVIGPDGTQGEVQDSDSWSVFARLGYQLSDTARIELFANRFALEGRANYVVVPRSPADIAAGRPTIGARGATPGEPASNRVETISLTLTDTDLAGGNLILQGYWNRSRDIFGGGVFADFQDPRIDPTRTLFEQSVNRSRKIGGRFSYEREVIDALSATVGFDSLWDRTGQELLQTGRAWVPFTEFRSLAPFGQLNLGLFDGKLRLAGGARWENVRLDIPDYETLFFYGPQQVAGGSPSFDDVLLNGGVIVEPVKGIRVYGSYAEGYTIADIGRILRAVNTAGVDVDNFLNVSPVVSNNREIGVEVKRGPLDLSATYFWSSSDLGSLLVRNAGDIFEVQRQRIEIEGLEINLGVRTPIDGLKLQVGYSHLLGKSDSDNDGRVDLDLDGANISPDRALFAADYVSGPLTARVQANVYLSRDFAGRAANTRFEGYTVTDAYIRYDTGLGGISLAVQNLTDEQYVSYYSDTLFQTDRTRFFAGRGRNFTLGWDWRF